MLGAIIGDIVGSVYEFNNYRAKDFTPFFHRRAFYTDDTVCTIAVADALIHERHPGKALKDWGQRYWENGGWGGRFAVWLGSSSLEPYGSYGNGAAMRVAPAGLLAAFDRGSGRVVRQGDRCHAQSSGRSERWRRDRMRHRPCPAAAVADGNP